MSNRRLEGPRGRTVVMLLAMWIVLYFGVRLVLEWKATLSSGVRVALAFVPTPVFVWFLWSFVRSVRGADELERRIQLEALAVAFPLSLALVTTLGLVQRAVELNFEDWSYNHVWPFFTVFYLLGLALARKRYQ